MDGASPSGPVASFWPNLLEDMAATAAEYAESNWEPLQLHPGDVTPVTGDAVEHVGFDVLLPDDEFEALTGVIDDGASFDAFDVYTTTVGGVVFLLVAMEDPTTETAVLFPLYYRPGEDGLAEVREHAEETGAVQTHLRRLAEDRYVTFTLDEPSLVFEPMDELQTET